MYGDRWGDEYYTLLDVVDRLIDLLTERYTSLYKASKAFGKHYTYFTKNLYTTCTPPRTKTIIDICKFLNVNMNYVVFGIDKGEYTGPSEVSYKNFMTVYNSVYKGLKCPVLNTLMCQWHKIKYKHIPLKYLIKVAREQKVTIDWLIGG